MSEPTSRAELVPIHAYSRRPLEWLWPGWVARGILTLLDGDPGMGKSTLAAELAARVSREGHKVLLLSAEDDPGRVLRPRLEASGAILDKVWLLDSVGAERRPAELPDDAALLGDLIDEEQAALVVVDPFLAFLGRGVQANSDQQIRRALHRLKQIAEWSQCAFLLIRHLNKTSHMPALYRGGGSIGILGACRTALIVGKDPADETARVLAMNKTNLSLPPRSLRYRLEAPGGVCRLVWDGECDWTAEEILRPMEEEQAQELSRVDECVEWMRELLARNGTMKSLDFQCEWMLADFAEATVNRARKRLGVRSRKVSWCWEVSLPEPAAEQLQGDSGSPT
jgi:RecA-family ATPase